MITAEHILKVVEPLIYRHRKLNLLILLILTLGFGYQLAQLQPSAGFDKQLPVEHPYIKNFFEYRDEFGGANRIRVAVIQKQGTIYNEQFLETLQAVHKDVFFLPGVERGSLRSLFSADTRYLEIVEGGFRGGRVIPATYKPTPEMFEQIQRNVVNSGTIGQLVAIDQSGAMVTTSLLDIDPTTGKRLDYRDFSEKLEAIRAKYQSEDIDIHIVGFGKVVGDIIEASTEVRIFFAIALVLTALLLWLYCGSALLAFFPLVSSVAAVVWELGLLHTFGYGLDPFAILIPFLVLSVGVSHGVQMVNAWVQEVADNGRNSLDASIVTFRRLAIPGTAALITDVVGFATIYMIKIPVIQEMAINAAFGIAAIIITNKVLMPILLSYATVRDLETFKTRQIRREHIGDALWHRISAITDTGPAIITILIALSLLGWGLWKAGDLQYGDFKQGVPELRPDSRYNNDSAAIGRKFAFGDDVLLVIVETKANGCIDYQVMENVDRFAWHMQNIPGVHSVVSLPQIGKTINSAWNDASLKMKVLPRNEKVMVQAVKPVPTSSGLLNSDCSLMPVVIFTADHKAETIDTVITAVENYRDNFSVDDVTGWSIATTREQADDWLNADERRNEAATKLAAIDERSGLFKDWEPEKLAELRPEIAANVAKEKALMNRALIKMRSIADEYAAPETSLYPADEAINKPIWNALQTEVLELPESVGRENIESLRTTSKAYDANNAHFVYYRLASGTIGVMAAANDEVRDKEKEILAWVYLALIIMCWLSFRSIPGVLCVLLPLSLVSLMAYGVMAQLEIGLKVATLPVAALAVGIGIDYGIYIYSTMAERIKLGDDLKKAYFHTLQLTGKAVVFTGVALGVSVCTWLWSDLQFQRDMGILLVFMFVANMFGAILLLPALARFLLNLGRIRAQR